MITPEYMIEIENEVYDLHKRINELREENIQLKEALKEILDLTEKIVKSDERETIKTICQYLI